MTAGVVLFTRDLRVHDHPALAAAARTFDRVVPLFVYDRGILRGRHPSPNRLRFLLESLDDLDRRLAGGLVRREGDVVEVAVRTAREARAGAIWMSADVTAYAAARERRLRAAGAGAGIEVRTFPGVTVVPPGRLTPAAGDHFRVFTPYYLRWRAAPWRRPEPAVRALRTVPDLGSSPPPGPPAGTSPVLPPGGETAGRRRLAGWLRHGLGGYAAGRDDLAGDRTSRLSPYLHLGCVSPLEVATRARELEGGEAFVRQLCWRDFHHQVTAAFPALGRRDYRPRGTWRHDDAALRRWKEGRTGVPIVDAGMRQLLREGWMHNRARLLVAAYLTRGLGIDWRDGAAHFLELLVDGDVANNSGNWQWVAGTGNQPRPSQTFDLRRQAQRFDPDGEYVRRYADWSAP